MQLGEHGGQAAVAGHGEQVARRHRDGRVQGGEIAAERHAQRQQRKRQAQDAGAHHGLGVGCGRLGHGGQPVGGHDAHEEPLEQGVHHEDDERREHHGARDVDLRVADFLAHGAARLETGEAPPDHGHGGDEPAAAQVAHEVGRGHEVRQLHVGDHGKEPDGGNAPEEEHEAVLELARQLHAAHVGDDERDQCDDGDDRVIDGKLYAERQEDGLEVVAERQRLAAGDGDERHDEVPSGKKASGAAQAQRRVLVRAAGEGQRRAHLAVHERRVDADERRKRRGKHHERAHLADDVASGGEQADADDGAGGDGDGLAQAERALEADGRLLLCAAFVRLVAHGRSFQRADRAGGPARCRMPDAYRACDSTMRIR